MKTVVETKTSIIFASYIDDLDCFTVDIRVNEGENTYFEGLFVQARTAGSEDASHGVFSTTDPYMKAYGCWEETSVSDYMNKGPEKVPVRKFHCHNLNNES